MPRTRRSALLLFGAMLGGAACSASRDVQLPMKVRTAQPADEPPLSPTDTPSPPMDVSPSATEAKTAPTVKEMAPSSSQTPTPGPSMVLPGIDVLLNEERALLSGRRIGLITNPTGRTRDGTSSIDALNSAADWTLGSLFSPEHGIRGQAQAGQAVESSVDAQTGLPVHSLYGSTTSPTAAMLSGLDALVYDIQDVGARTYTYISTLLEVMQAAASHQLPVFVLDRPDQITGSAVDGNVLDPRFTSFVGAAPIAMRYAMTIGELGQWFNGELGVGAELTVVPLRGWTRAMWFDQTGLEWVNPSPNLRSLSAATLYPGTVLFEGTNLSEGRGTDAPFEWIGAPWMDAGAWADALNVADLAGATFTPRDRTPDGSKFAGQLCHGVQIEITDRDAMRPMALGVSMLSTALDVSRGRVRITPNTFDGLAGTEQLRNAIEAGRPPAEIVNSWDAEIRRFLSARERYLLY